MATSIRNDDHSPTLSHNNLPANNDIDAHEREAQLTIDLIKEGLVQFRSENGEQKFRKSVIVVGKTGVGKSTVINVLAQRKLRGISDEFGDVIIKADPPLPDFIISEKTISETSIPRKWISDDNEAYWDCPGISDNRGGAKEIANAVLVKHISELSESSKIMVVVDEEGIIDDRKLELLSLIRTLNLMMNKNESAKNSLAFLISKASKDLSLEQAKAHITAFKTFIENHQNLKKPEKDQLVNFVNALHDHLTIFRKPDQDQLIDTKEIKREILNNLEQVSYSKIQVNLGLSPEATLIAKESYAILNRYIETNISNFLKTFDGVITSFLSPYENQNLDEADKKTAQEKLRALLQKVEGLSSVEYSQAGGDILISKCSEIAQECQGMIPESVVKEAEKLSLLHNLEPFIEIENRIPMDYVKKIRMTIETSHEKIAKALVNIEAKDEEMKAMLEKKRAEAQLARYAEEDRRAKEAENRRQKSREEEKQRQQEKLIGTIVEVVALALKLIIFA